MQESGKDTAVLKMPQIARAMLEDRKSSVKMKTRLMFALGALLTCAAILSAQTGAGPSSAAGQGAVRMTQNDPERLAALALEQQGKDAEAETAWKALVRAHPADPEPYAHLGLLEARQEHYKAAIPLYRKALALGPPLESVRLNLGLALFKDDQMRGALREFEGLLPNHPDDVQLNALIGMAHYGLGEYKDAVPFLKAAAQKDPRNLMLRLALAHSCLWSKQPQCVMDVYREILEIDPNSAAADMIAGEALDQMGDNAGALAQFQAAEKANPNEPDVHFGLAYLLWSQKLYAQALPEFQADLASSPDHAQARVFLADCYMHLQDEQHAQPALERAVREDPSNELGHLDLGIIYADQRHNQAALTQYRTAIKLDPNDADPHWRLSRLYLAMGNTEAARTESVLVSKMKKQMYQSLYDQISRAGAARHNAPPASDPQ
jgi:tetratricopeptide (TPR) repeat protein